LLCRVSLSLGFSAAENILWYFVIPAKAEIHLFLCSAAPRRADSVQHQRKRQNASARLPAIGSLSLSRQRK
jgi:hypothetical protein